MGSNSVWSFFGAGGIAKLREVTTATDILGKTRTATAD